MCICMYVCIYIYIYVCYNVNMYNIYIYIYICNDSSRALARAARGAWLDGPVYGLARWVGALALAGCPPAGL